MRPVGVPKPILIEATLDLQRHPGWRLAATLRNDVYDIIGGAWAASAVQGPYGETVEILG